MLPEFYQRVREGVELTVFGLRRANDEKLPAFEGILTDLAQLEEQIHDNHS